MRAAVLALVVSLGMAPAVDAGAWLREEGKTFFAAKVGTNKSRDVSADVYAEYGLSDNVTLGLDVSYGLEFNVTDAGSGIVFLRFPLGPTNETHRFAWHAGIGTRYLNLEFYPAAELGASWGRGVKVSDRWGWVNIDTTVNTSQSPVETRYKFDATLGLTLNDRFKVMGQWLNTVEGGETYSRVAPSLLIQGGKAGTTFQLSAEIPTVGGGGTFYKIGFWREF